ncbi:ABC transporter permease [Micromonospora costi]|uniref:ABC transporter permease n=1 Tax=Micromonospora costi TaxID=1530042 RepID=UPI0033CA2C63
MYRSRRDQCRLQETRSGAAGQTRTVGLVTLPGAFVNVLLGGASAVTAGVTQLFVLVGLLAVEVVAVVITVELVARNRLRPVEPVPALAG